MSRMTKKQYNESRRVYRPGYKGLTIRRSRQQIKRNAKCPCNSGLKFKECCLGSIKVLAKHSTEKGE